MTMYSEFQERGLSSWLDVKMRVQDIEAMKEGAANSKGLIAIITDNGKDSYFSREMCRQEIAWARSADKPIVPVVRTEDKARIEDFVKEAAGHGITLTKEDFMDFDRSSKRRVNASIEDILQKAGLLSA